MYNTNMFLLTIKNTSFVVLNPQLTLQLAGHKSWNSEEVDV